MEKKSYPEWNLSKVLLQPESSDLIRVRILFACFEVFYCILFSVYRVPCTMISMLFLYLGTFFVLIINN